MSYTIAMRHAFAFAVLLLSTLLPLSAGAASIYLDPASGTYGPGDTFIATIRIDTESQCINAAHVELTYPTDSLRVVDFGRGDSIFNLWVEEPKIDSQKGLITFSGGIPGGYCGKIVGDPEESNILGQVVFTVLKTAAKSVAIDVTAASEVYLNDGLGTKAPLTERAADISIAPQAQLSTNEWVDQVALDTTPPEPFSVQVESTKGVFGGAYYAVFSTVDKQSGIDHYEILENGIWKRVQNPYKLQDQSLKNGVMIKAVDKAGNERIGEYNPKTTPPPAYGADLTTLLSILALVLVALLAKWLLDRRKRALPPAGA